MRNTLPGWPVWLGSVLLGWMLGTNQAQASCVDTPLRGVNLAGAEFNGKRLPGVYGRDYVYPAAADVDAFAAMRMNVIRLPFRWERLQPALLAALDGAELERIRKVVALAKARDMCVILDMHNYGMYRGEAVGSAAVPAAAFYDAWQKIGLAFANDKHVAFGLMNEPAKLGLPQWKAIAQTTVSRLRQKQVNNLLLVSGGGWSGVHSWFKGRSGTSNADLFASLADPARRFYLEVHQYADPNFSGTSAECVAPEQLAGYFGKLTGWARTNGKQLFLGEFGTAGTAKCLAALETMLAATHDRSVWGGWTYWAAGRWWGNYMFSIQPRSDGQPWPQVAVLEKYLGE